MSGKQKCGAVNWTGTTACVLAKGHAGTHSGAPLWEQDYWSPDDVCPTCGRYLSAHINAEPCTTGPLPPSTPTGGPPTTRTELQWLCAEIERTIEEKK